MLRQSKRAVFSSLNWLKEWLVHITKIVLIFNLAVAMCNVLQLGLEHHSNETCTCHSVNDLLRNAFLGVEGEIHSAVLKAEEMKSEGEGLQMQKLSSSVRILAETHGGAG